MKIIRIILMVSALFSAFAGSGCHKGAAEKAGEKIDKAAEKTGDAIKDGANKAKDAVK